MGAEPTAQENAAFAAALIRYAECDDPDDFSALTAFLDAHPGSPWAGGLLTNLGLVYYRRGYYSRALQVWSSACALAMPITDPAQRPLADRAVGELAYMLAKVGRVSELDTLLKAVADRGFCGPATEKIAAARAGLAEMRTRPEVSFRCGPLALHRIMLAVHPENPRSELIHASESTDRGFSMHQLEKLSQRLGLHYRAAFRESGADLVVPSVVHFTVDHFAAVIHREDDRYLLEDPTFKNDAWVTAAALDAEASGYFLIPQRELPNGWRPVEAAEAQRVWGRGNVPLPPDPPGPCDPNTGQCCDAGAGGGLGGGDDGDGDGDGDGEGPAGLAVPSIYLLDVSLSLTDTPVGYIPPVGPAVQFTVRYRQRDNQFSSTFNYSNFGPKWTFDWLAYIVDHPMTPQADVTYYMRGGGFRTFAKFDSNTQTFTRQPLDQTLLTRFGGPPTQRPITYEMFFRDGSALVFGESDGGSVTRRIFLTRVIDPAGNAVTLTYDSALRLTTITDAIGQHTTLEYTNASDSFKITKVTDPFGRFATFGYNTANQLISITDVLGLVSGFRYASPTTDLTTTLITPYGVTTFTNAQSGTTRSMEILYPDGNRERAEFNQSTSLGIPGSDPPDTVPVGMATTNQFLAFRNTFYWDQQGCAYAYGDYTKARIYHWLHSTDMNSPVGVLESTKAPLEGRVWYDYAGQATSDPQGSIVIGTTSAPAHIGRVLDDGSPQLYYREYNDFGNITKAVDPVGRTFSYTYAPNGIDLLATRQTRAGQSELVHQLTYNAQHQPWTSTDAAGQTTIFTYTARGQIESSTDPLGHTTTYQYDANGCLRTITGPLSATDTTTFTYDAFGRIHIVTDNSGYTLAYDYDAADRLRTITFPDATTFHFDYTLLDLSTITDRAGRQTRFGYNTVRQPIKRTDPLGRITLFQWCKCGALRRLADPMGRTTTWRHDIQGRLTLKQYADGSEVTYLYEDTTSRLEQRIDEALQITQYDYNRDDTLAGISYPDAAVATAAVTFTYDPDYSRISSMTDGTGTTRYGYIPITAQPALGAGQLETIDGPLPNATITYGYDELGRRTSTDISGTSSSVVLDAAGRVTRETNALGTFTYAYDGNSSRTTTQSCPNGVATARRYGTNLQDFFLQQITNIEGGASFSQLSYGYDPRRGLITSWAQQADTQPPSLFSLGYDDADQLKSATVVQGGTTTATFGYTYDPAGNRLSEQIGPSVTHLSYNALNELTASDAPGGAATTYQWDPEHRLVKATSGTRTTELTYDGWGRCSSIVQSTSATPTSRRAFLWAGDQIAEEYAPDGTVSKRFFRQGVQRLTGAAAGNYFYTRDHLGSIRELTNNTGTVTARYSYDPHGRPTQLSGSLHSDFGFAGMFYPQELAINMTRFRLYDPNIGRWLSRDPFPNGNAANSPDRGSEPFQSPNHYTYVGDQLSNLLGRQGVPPLVPTQAELLAYGPNLYTYVGNNPVNLIDPLGLDCQARQIFKPKPKPKPRKRNRRKRKPRSDREQFCSNLKFYYLANLRNAIAAPFMPLDTIQGDTPDIYKGGALYFKAVARAQGCSWAQV
jgi:RHS repeat-associated protein